MSNYSARVLGCVKKALPVAIKTSIWFLKIMLPVSLFVTLLSYFNILPYISSFASPLFTLIGLPGDAALVFVTSIFTNIYTVIALLSTLDFSVRESLIMATMCLISHNFVVETIVLQKTGSSAVWMVILRVLGSFVAAIGLNWLLPEMSGKMMAETAVSLGFWETMLHWLESSVMLGLKIVLVISGLMILQRLLEEFGILKILSAMLSPLMRLFGCGFPVAGGEHGRIGLRFRDHDGLCQDGKTGTSGGRFAESSLGDFSFATGGSAVVCRDGITCGVVDISPCRVSRDCCVDSSGHLFIAGASTPTGKS